MRELGVTTYGVREFKAHLSEILNSLADGDEVIITRRGKPCARLTTAPRPDSEKPSLSTLRGKFAHMPDVEYEEFVALKKIWEPRLPEDVEEAAPGAG